ncbi:MAG: ATP-binding protein [Spirochaetota bacterium]
MRSLRSASSTTAGLVSIISIYTLLIVLILLFSNQLLKDIADEGAPKNFIIIPLAIVLPLFLFVTIIYNIIRLIREKGSGNPGVRFKIRLMLFFTFITFLSSIPQAILSISFIDTTLNSWFSLRMGNALKGGVHIALEYYNEKIESLKRFTESAVFASILRDIERTPNRAWNNIQSANPDIHSLQIFKADGKEFFFDGNELGRIVPAFIQGRDDGFLPKESKQDASILRILKRYSLRDDLYYVVVSGILPQEFDREAEQLTHSLETYKQLERYQTIFRVVLIIFYSFFSFPIVLLSILVSFILSEEVIRPIVYLEEATKRVAEGDFSFRILTRSNDELFFLISSFNKMVAELERSRRELKQTEKVTVWQEIAQRMAHEIKNPLTPIKLSAQRLLRKYQSDKPDFERILEPAIATIIHEVENLTKLLSEFRNFARMPAPQMSPVKLIELIEKSVAVFSTSYHNVRFHTEGVTHTIMLNIDPGQIDRVFTNLFKNAVEAITGEGSIFVRTDLVTKENLRYCRIQIQDTGSGINPEHYTLIFKPYFTTKKRGTGLGLAIVERIVFDHKGQIWFETQKDIGTTFFIDLPME